jgi:hypothetical protein
MTSENVGGLICNKETQRKSGHTACDWGSSIRPLVKKEPFIVHGGFVAHGCNGPSRFIRVVTAEASAGSRIIEAPINWPLMPASVNRMLTSWPVAYRKP